MFIAKNYCESRGERENAEFIFLAECLKPQNFYDVGSLSLASHLYNSLYD